MFKFIPTVSSVMEHTTQIHTPHTLFTNTVTLPSHITLINTHAHTISQSSHTYFILLSYTHLTHLTETSYTHFIHTHTYLTNLTDTSYTHFIPHSHTPHTGSCNDVSIFLAVTNASSVAHSGLAR